MNLFLGTIIQNCVNDHDPAAYFFKVCNGFQSYKYLWIKTPFLTHDRDKYEKPKSKSKIKIGRLEHEI